MIDDAQRRLRSGSGRSRNDRAVWAGEHPGLLATETARPPPNPLRELAFLLGVSQLQEATMGFGKGALLWLLGIPLPIIILLALFWR